MENTQISPSFAIQELVNPEIFNHPAIGVRCKDFIHPEAANTLEAIKTATGDVITINDWLWKGVDNASYTNSGLRLPMKQLPSQETVLNLVEVYQHDPDMLYSQMNKLYKDIGAIFSSHKFGCGFDLKFKNMSAQEAYDFILKNQHLFPNITRMENSNATIKGKNTPWVHCEIGAARAPGVEIQVFMP